MYLPFLSERWNKPAFQRGWLAFAQDGQGLRWLHMASNADGKPAVLAMEQVGGRGELEASLRQTAVVGRLRRHRCLAVLGPEEYQIVQTDLPPVPDEEMRPALRWAVRDLLDYPVDDIGVDYLPVPVDPSRGQANRPAYVVCAQRAALERYTRAFDSARGRLHVADVVETAHRNIAARVEEPGQAIALLGVTTDYAVLSFTVNGELCSSRRMDVGVSHFLQAEDEARTQMYDRILLEVQRSLDTFERQFHFAPLARLLVSPLPDAIDLLPFLADNLYQRVEPLDLASIIDFSAVEALQDAATQAACLNLLGAALRAEELEWT